MTIENKMQNKNNNIIIKTTNDNEGDGVFNMFFGAPGVVEFYDILYCFSANQTIIDILICYEGSGIINGVRAIKRNDLIDENIKLKPIYVSPTPYTVCNDIFYNPIINNLVDKNNKQIKINTIKDFIPSDLTEEIMKDKGTTIKLENGINLYILGIRN